jgi:cardiolipin synthase
VLASLGFAFRAETAITAMMVVVAVTTLLSIAAYLAEWIRHMNSAAIGK